MHSAMYNSILCEPMALGEKMMEKYADEVRSERLQDGTFVRPAAPEPEAPALHLTRNPYAGVVMPKEEPKG